MGPSNCHAGEWKVISNSTDIDFIRGRSRKKCYLFLQCAFIFQSMLSSPLHNHSRLMSCIDVYFVNWNVNGCIYGRLWLWFPHFSFYVDGLCAPQMHDSFKSEFLWICFDRPRQHTTYLATVTVPLLNLIYNGVKYATISSFDVKLLCLQLYNFPISCQWYQQVRLDCVP